MIRVRVEKRLGDVGGGVVDESHGFVLDEAGADEIPCQDSAGGGGSEGGVVEIEGVEFGGGRVAGVDAERFNGGSGVAG